MASNTINTCYFSFTTHISASDHCGSPLPHGIILIRQLLLLFFFVTNPQHSISQGYIVTESLRGYQSPYTPSSLIKMSNFATNVKSDADESSEITKTLNNLQIDVEIAKRSTNPAVIFFSALATPWVLAGRKVGLIEKNPEVCAWEWAAVQGQKHCAVQGQKHCASE
jgi:hypothetical protein